MILDSENVLQSLTTVVWNLQSRAKLDTPMKDMTQLVSREGW